MPLTSAERSRRYREKLKKENPDKLEAQRIKNLQRIKQKKKKVSEMTQEEAETRRKVWRKEKQASRQKKKQSVQDSVNVAPNNNLQSEDIASASQIHCIKSIQHLKKKNTFLANKCRRFMTYNIKLKRQKEAYKKRNQRLLQQNKDEVNYLETELLKMKARNEMLEHTLQKTYQNCTKRTEKQTLKKLVKNSENKKIITKMLGLQGKVREKKKRTKPTEIPEIEKFYMRDDVSRNTAGKKETRTKDKTKKQIRYLCDTLVNTFKKYKTEGGRYGFTTFYRNKPFFILSPGINSRNTCLCPKHSNIDYLHTALVKHGIISGTRKDVLENICCDTNNYDCMYHTCRQCKNRKVQFNLVTEEKLNQEVEWLEWDRKEHIYEKKDLVSKKEVKTMRTEKVIKKGSIRELRTKYENDMILFKKHHFNNNHMQKQYQKTVSELKDNECLIVCDFSESYEAKMANEVQSMHFGASKRQISLHTGMVYTKNEAQSFCTMSDENSHQPPAIWAHLAPVIEMVKTRTPNVEIFHFFTDGPSSQYRQKNNFYLLAYFTKTYGFKYSTWSFYEAHHGKSVADGIGGSVKRSLDKKVCLGTDIVDAKDAYEVCKDCLKKTKVFLILKSDIDNISKILPAKLPVLKGTMQLHQIITDKNDKFKIAYRDVSCFCGEQRGQCECFSPKPHYVIDPRITLDGMDGNNPVDSFLLSSAVMNLPFDQPVDTRINDDQPIAEIGSNCSLSINEIIDTTELPIISVQQLEEYLPKNECTFTNEPKIKILEERRFFPKSKKVLTEIHHNSVYNIVPSTQCCKIKTKGVHCQKCLTTISGRKGTCMVCKKIYCSECIGQQIYPDFICDPCLES